MASPEEIVNLALARLGAETIKDFNENTKNARLGKIVYDFHRKALLTKYDWSFARKVVQLAVASEEPLTGYAYAYALPSDCLNPIRIVNFNNPRIRWEVYAAELHSDISPFVLRYTYDCNISGHFSSEFITSLWTAIAATLCPSIVQDKALTKLLMQEAVSSYYDAIEVDASKGIEYRVDTENPNFDSFVNPDVSGIG